MSQGAPIFPGVAPRSPLRAPESSSAGSAAPRWPGYAIWVAFTVLWVALGVLLLVSPETVSLLWARVAELPIWAEVLVWLAFLPIAVAVAVWETSWALWIRLAVLAGCVVWTTYGLWPGRARS